jgi:hypothetical protein
LFAGGNGQAGNMFVVQAHQEPITIFSIDIHTYSKDPDLKVMIYTKAGSFWGYETSADGWTKICDTTVQGLGSPNPTPIPASAIQEVTIQPGDTQSFYVTMAKPIIRYTNGHDFRTMGDEYITFEDSVGTRYPFAGIHRDRIWNGQIHYRIAAVAPPVEIVYKEAQVMTTFAGGNGQAGNMFTVQAHQQPITIFSMDIHTYSEDPNLEVMIYTKSGSFWGSETSTDGWTKICDTTVQGLGSPNQTPIPANVMKEVTIKPGDMQSFYVTLAKATIRYTNGHNGRDMQFMGDEYITFEDSVGVLYPLSSIHKDRIWNGQIHYRVASEATS